MRVVLSLETPPGALWFFGRVVVRLASARRRRAQGVIFLCRVCVPAGVCLDGVLLCGGKVVVCHGGSAPEPGWRGIGFLFPLTAPRRAPQKPLPLCGHWSGTWCFQLSSLVLCIASSTILPAAFLLFLGVQGRWQCSGCGVSSVWRGPIVFLLWCVGRRLL